MQYIFIRELKVEALVGVHEGERRAPQMLTFDLEIGVPDKRAFLSDNLAETIDYANVVAMIKRELAASRYYLLERLAQHLCHRIEQEFGSSWIRISIAKGDILAGVKQVGVVLEHGLGQSPAR